MNVRSAFCIFLSLCLPHFSEASQLYDRLMTQKLFQETGQAVITQDRFKKDFQKLDEPLQKKALQLGEQLQYIFPPRLLESYLTWRFISPNDRKAVQVLKHALLYRLLILRDTIDSPQSSAEQIKIAKSHLKELTQIEELGPDNIWTLTHQLIDHKAKILHAIDDHNFLALALKETPWLGQQLHIPELTRYVFSPLGYLKTSSLSWIKEDEMVQKFQELLGEANQHLVIEAQVFLQFPSIEKVLKENISKNIRYQIIFHTPQDKNLLSDWEEFRSKRKIPEENLVFTITPQVLKDQLAVPPKASIEAAPLFPRELDPITSFGGLINIDPLTKNATTVLTGPLSIARESAIVLKGPAAAALVLANSLMAMDEWSTLLDIRYEKSLLTQTVRPARLLPQQNIFELRPLIVDMISKAKKEVFIDQFFLFDAHVVQSLIKRKIQKPQLDVRIFMDHNMNYSMGGFPNTLFLLDMMKYDIQVKSRKKSKSNSAILITDSHVGLIGPQNLIPTQLEKESTLQAVQVFGADFLKPRVIEFKSDWNQSNQLFELNIKEFQFMTPTEILDRNDSKLLNAIGAEFLRQYD